MFEGEMLTVDEMAERLGVTRRTVNRRILSGQLQATYVGGTRLVSVSVHEDGDGTPRTEKDAGTRDIDPTRTGRGRSQDSAIALITTLQGERSALVSQMIEAERRLADVGAQLAEHRTLAEVAVSQVEAEREIRTRAEQDLAVEIAERAALAAELEAMKRRASAEHERARRLADAARLPWYAGRRRRSVLRAMGAEG